MNAQLIFSNHIERRFDCPCPATQDAIDAVVRGENFRGRIGMLEAMRGPHYGKADFNSSLLSAWTPREILFATGRSVEFWLSLSEK
jgi:hypothetical protein